jgi:hypothetical protein
MYYEAALAGAADADRRGDLREAEEHYRSAVWRAQNHLTNRDTATALYEFGRFYRSHGEFKAAASRLEASLDLAGRSGTFDASAIGRRKVELAAAYAGLDRWTEGADLLLGIRDVLVTYRKNEGELVRLLVEAYVGALKELDEDERSDALSILLQELPPPPLQAPPAGSSGPTG